MTEKCQRTSVMQF